MTRKNPFYEPHDDQMLNARDPRYRPTPSEDPHYYDPNWDPTPPNAPRTRQPLDPLTPGPLKTWKTAMMILSVFAAASILLFLI